MAEAGRVTEGLEHLEEALALTEAVGDRVLLNGLISNIGLVHMFQGDLGAARHRFTECLTLASELGDVDALLTSYVNLAFVALVDDDPQAVRDSVAAALPMLRRRGRIGLVGYVLLAAALAADADPHRAAALHGAADMALSVVDESWETFEARLRDADHRRLRAELGDAAFDQAYRSGAALAPDEAIALASA
jgi:hypothetical protein